MIFLRTTRNVVAVRRGSSIRTSKSLIIARKLHFHRRAIVFLPRPTPQPSPPPPRPLLKYQNPTSRPSIGHLSVLSPQISPFILPPNQHHPHPYPQPSLSIPSIRTAHYTSPRALLHNKLNAPYKFHPRCQPL